MKYLFSFSVPLLIIFGVVYFGSNNGDTNAYASYKSFSEFCVSNNCNGSSGLGGTCSASCPNACSCGCSTGLFKCRCTCTCPDETSIEPETAPEFEIAPEERWSLLKEIISTENSEIAKEILTDISELHDFGINKKAKEYDALAEILDEKIMQLQPATLDKIVTEFF